MVGKGGDEREGRGRRRRMVERERGREREREGGRGVCRKPLSIVAFDNWSTLIR